MRKTIISDTSCFILLSNIGEMDLLQQLYGQITTTLEVAIEFGEILPHWVEIITPTDKAQQQKLELQVDKGEAAVRAESPVPKPARSVYSPTTQSSPLQETRFKQGRPYPRTERSFSYLCYSNKKAIMQAIEFSTEIKPNHPIEVLGANSG